MKLLPKLMAVAIGLAASAPSFAAITTGNTGEIFLSVFDPNFDNGAGLPTGKGYVRDLGIRIANFSVRDTPLAGDSANRVTDGTSWALASNPSGSVQTGSVLEAGYDITFTADPLLVSLLQGASNLGDVRFNVTALDTSSVTNPLRIFTTTNASESEVEGMTNSNFSSTLTTGSVVRNYVSINNGLGSHGAATADNGSNTNAPDAGSGFFPAGLAGNLGSSAPFNTLAGLGQDLRFYEIQAGPGNFVNATPYASALTFGVWSLDSTGVLTYSVQAIPEPETYALMAAGLAIVAGVARRRRI